MEWLQMLMRGGFMMYPLLLSGLVAMIVIVDRLLFFQKLGRASNASNELLEMCKQKNFQAVIGKNQDLPSPLSALAKTAAEHLAESKFSEAEFELSLKTEAEAWLPFLERRLDILDTVITAAPLMGLLGTITGMMASFKVLSESGVNEPSAITGGVAEALIATATGLVIALLCLLAFNYCNNQVRRRIAEMELFANRLLGLKKQFDRNPKNG